MLDLSSFPQESHYRGASERKIHAWGTAIGAWGDTLCCLGEFFNYPSEGGICYYGFDPQIPKFLLRQNGIHAVDHVIPRTQEEYVEFVKGTASEENYPLPFSKKVISTHLRPSVARSWEVKRWHGARLDRCAYDEAAEIVSSLPDGWMLLQPFSTQSCILSRHYPYWQELIRLLLQFSGRHFVLVGQGWQTVGSHPYVTDLVGKLNSMQTVFALAEMAEGIVSTVNSLAIYSVIQNLPCLALGNEALESGEHFRKWIDYRPVRLIRYQETVDRAFAAFAETFRI